MILYFLTFSHKIDLCNGVCEKLLELQLLIENGNHRENEIKAHLELHVLINTVEPPVKCQAYMYSAGGRLQEVVDYKSLDHTG